MLQEYITLTLARIINIAQCQLFEKTNATVISLVQIAFIACQPCWD